VTVYVRRPGDPKKWLANISCISKQVSWGCRIQGCGTELGLGTRVAAGGVNRQRTGMSSSSAGRALVGMSASVLSG
jgi:hypothetical protein